VFRFGSAIAGGSGGQPGITVGRTCFEGPSGQAIVGQSVLRPGVARSLYCNTPVLETEEVSLLFEGVPFDLPFLLLSLGQQHLFLPNLGALLPALPGATLPLPQFGLVTSQTATLLLPSGLVDPTAAILVFNQGLFLSAQQQVILGAPAAFVILDENHDWFDGCP
jgi:hypothetical protein